MAITVKDASGVEREVAGKGAAYTGVALGGAALGLNLLNGGLLGNGILGGNTPTVVNNVVAGAEILEGMKSIGNCCFLDRDTFWSTMLNQANTQAERDINTERRFAALESSIAVNTTANQYQNTIIHNQFEWERLLSEKNLALATCRCIQGDVAIPFSKLTMGCVDKTHVIDTYEARPFREQKHDHGHGCVSCGPCGF